MDGVVTGTPREFQVKEAAFPIAHGASRLVEREDISNQ